LLSTGVTATPGQLAFQRGELPKPLATAQSPRRSVQKESRAPARRKSADRGPHSSPIFAYASIRRPRRSRRHLSIGSVLRRWMFLHRRKSERNCTVVHRAQIHRRDILLQGIEDHVPSRRHTLRCPRARRECVRDSIRLYRWSRATHSWRHRPAKRIAPAAHGSEPRSGG